jgi:predicted Zn-dependent protease
LLSTAEAELRRAQGDLGKLDPAPYFISYSIHDQNTSMAVASQGSLLTSTHMRQRLGDVVMRIGAPDLDNTHQENRMSGISSGALPLEDDSDAIAHVLWQLTDREYRKASKAYLNVKTSTKVHAPEEDLSADFSKEAPQSHIESNDPPRLPDQAKMEKLAKRYSEDFRKYPYILSSAAIITEQHSRSYFVSSEGTSIVVPGALVRLVIEAQAVADDGMELVRVESFQADQSDHLPSEQEVLAHVSKMATDLEALRSAPAAEPFDGPALLSGRAAAVFFHEVLGHRLEGRHQRGEQEGQTFTKQVNQRVLPEFLSISDDPTRNVLDGVELSGSYQYDDEGLPGRKVDVIQDGILKDFLMSRMPIKNFSQSNGHGRAQPGLMPTGRQGNLIVSSSKTVKDSELHQKLVDEIKKQGKPYGLYFEDIQGGFTLTQRSAPQAFQVLPVLVWRVYPDGRPDELVRGVDIVGTPMAALNRILLTGDKTEVFNGICGADSGNVPVSASAPAMLFSEIEVQKRAHLLNRPPVLPPPGFENSAEGSQSKSGDQP